MYSMNRKLIVFEYSPCSELNTAIHSRIPNTRRTTDPRTTVIQLQYIRLHNRTTHLLLFIAFAIALTFIMLFIFNLIIRPSLFIRFLSPLQCHFECFSERVQQINICDASFNRKMSPPRSVIRQVTGHVDSFRFTCRRYESVNVCVSRQAAREE